MTRDEGDSASSGQSRLRLDVISIFPDYLTPLHLSLVGRAIATGLVDLRLHDLREFTHDRHRTVDDSPFGGGPGMVMRPQPWGEALTHVFGSAEGTAAEDTPLLVIPTPSGELFRQGTAGEWARHRWLVFACGRYEGIDARVAQWAGAQLVSGNPVQVAEVSIGDYVLAGAEAAVLVMVEAVVRLLPGVLGNERSHQDDSFAPGDMANLLEGPVYTRPATWNGLTVPEVLRCGDHAAVDRWRRGEALARTARMRPDLLGPRPD